MMITIKDMLNAKESINKLSEMKFANFKTTRDIVGLIKSVDAELEFFNSQLQKLLQTYGTKDKDGNLMPNEDGSVQLSEETLDEFKKASSELLELDISTYIEPITIYISEILDNTIILSAKEMILLEKFVCWEDFREIN